MAKFKVGDRVKFIRDNTAGGAIYGAKGDTGTVVAVTGMSSVDVSVDNSSLGFDPIARVDDLEIDAATSDAWDYDPRTDAVELKEGGRFRVLKDCPHGGYKTGDTFVARSVHDGIWFIDKDGDERVITRIYVQPISADGGLTIEVGKHYRTRDGRIVGPVTATTMPYFLDIYPFRCGEWFVKADGTVNHGMGFDENMDLVAVAAAPANDNAPIGAELRPHIVARFDDGQPHPASRPFVHPNEAAATAEAERLASQNPGVEFGVFALVTKRIGEVTVRTAA